MSIMKPKKRNLRKIKPNFERTEIITIRNNPNPISLLNVKGSFVLYRKQKKGVEEKFNKFNE